MPSEPALQATGEPGRRKPLAPRIEPQVQEARGRFQVGKAGTGEHRLALPRNRDGSFGLIQPDVTGAVASKVRAVGGNTAAQLENVAARPRFEVDELSDPRFGSVAMLLDLREEFRRARWVVAVAKPGLIADPIIFADGHLDEASDCTAIAR